jgi:nitrite reductase (NADH) large subunit
MCYVLIGGGVASVTAAGVLSEEDPGATIEIYGEELHWTYRRPRLPELLAGEVALEQMLVHPAAWYEERGITVHRGAPVEALDPAAGEILLADGRRVPYDSLLLATGSTPFIPPISGTDRTGFFSLRTVDDASSIRQYAQGRKRAIVIGGGLLGLEAARGLRKLGLEVIIVEFFPRLLPRQLDGPGAVVLTGIIEAMGISVVTDAASEAVLGDGGVSGLRLKDGRELEGDLLLCSTGIRSRVELAQQAGLEVNRGVVVDGRLRTSAERIYAAGDVAEFEGRVYGILPAAWDQARIAAANMAGRQAHYRGTVPSTTLKVVGVDLTSMGEVNPEGEGSVELRSEPEAGRYIKVVLRDGRLVGAIVLGERRRIGAFRRLIAEKTDVSAFAERLLEEDFSLGG